MRKTAALLILLPAVLLGGCMRHAGRNIREIMLTKATTTPDGKGQSDTLIFYRDGRAERQTRVSEHVNSWVPIKSENGKMSTDRFEGLAKTVEENDFFTKEEHENDAEPGVTGLVVTADDGSKSILNVDENDPQIKNIISAIKKEASQVEWTLERSN